MTTSSKLLMDGGVGTTIVLLPQGPTEVGGRLAPRWMASKSLVFAGEQQERRVNERRKSLPGVSRTLRHTLARLRSLDNFSLGIQKGPPSIPSSLPGLAESTPTVQPAIRNGFFGDVPRSMSPLGLDSEHNITTSVDLHSSTTTVLRSPHRGIHTHSQTDTINMPDGVGPRFSPTSLFEAQYSSHGSASIPIYPSFHVPSSSDSSTVGTTFQLTHHMWPHDTSSMINAMVKDPEALLDTQRSNIADASWTDLSTVVTALIAALGLLSSHSSNPKVTVFQLSAAAVSFTLIALHSFHCRTLADVEQHSREFTFVHQLLKYFPLLIFVSCWILFLLSITFMSPKVMTVTVSLVVLASIPMLCGARLPAALTLAIITLFGLTFFALVFLVCILPTEWMV